MSDFTAVRVADQGTRITTFTIQLDSGCAGSDTTPRRKTDLAALPAVLRALADSLDTAVQHGKILSIGYTNITGDSQTGRQLCIAVEAPT